MNTPTIDNRNVSDRPATACVNVGDRPAPERAVVAGETHAIVLGQGDYATGYLPLGQRLDLD